MTKVAYSLVPNEADDEIHCFQACFRMVVEAFTGEQLSLAESEQLTGFTRGRLSWPLAGMHALGERGLAVRLIEDFIPENFLRDPASELERQYGSKAKAQAALREIDVQAETRNLEACLRHANVQFISRSPTMEDFCGALAREQRLAVPHCNYRELVGRDGYVGHYVVAKEWDPGAVIVDDPGLPAQANFPVPHDRFARATGIACGSGSVILVGRR